MTRRVMTRTHWIPGYGIEKSEFYRLERDGVLPAFLEQQKLRAALKIALKEYVHKVLAKMTCSRCGVENGWQPLHLHHPDNDGHLGNVWSLVSALASIEKIKAEIARCEPLCASCHIKHHKPIRGHFKQRDKTRSVAR